MKSILCSGISMLALTGMLLVAGPSHALMVDVSTSAGDAVIDPILAAKGAGLTLTLSSLPTNAVTDALVTLKVRGDFNSSQEYIDMGVDGVCCDRWLDNNNGNDLITGSDTGNQYGSIITGTRVILLADLLPILADGELAFLFGYKFGGGTDVDNLGYGDYASVRIQYESADVAPVPEPGTMLLFGTGLAGVVAWRMKKGQA